MCDTRSGLAAAVIIATTSDSDAGQRLDAILRDHGYVTMVLADPDQTALLLPRIDPACILVDLELNNARLLVSRLVERSRHVIAASQQPTELAWALQIGCHDVLSSPWHPEVAAHKLHRAAQTHAPGNDAPIRIGPLLIDPRTETMRCHGRLLPASRILVRLAAYLATRRGQVISTETLLRDVWRDPWAHPARVHQAVWRLRICLGAAATLLIVRRGYGYGFADDDHGDC